MEKLVNSNQDQSLVTSNVQCQFFSFQKCIPAMQDVTIRGQLVEGCMGTLYYFCNFSVNLKLFLHQKVMKLF